MFKQYIGWKFTLVAVAVVIIVTTIWFVNNLSEKIQHEETKNVATWVEANRELLQASADENLNLAVSIVTTNTTIPLILTDDHGKIIDHRNLDSMKVVHDTGYLEGQLSVFKNQHPPFIMAIDAKTNYYIYYGDSIILKQVRYYPYIQLLVVALFIGIVLFALSSTNRATQNLVWVGMAKETAHQLGTPLSSMEAWLEILKDKEDSVAIATELGKDVDRLKLISERFFKDRQRAEPGGAQPGGAGGEHGGLYPEAGAAESAVHAANVRAGSDGDDLAGAVRLGGGKPAEKRAGRDGRQGRHHGADREPPGAYPYRRDGHGERYSKKFAGQGF